MSTYRPSRIAASAAILTLISSLAIPSPAFPQPVDDEDGGVVSAPDTPRGDLAPRGEWPTVSYQQHSASTTYGEVASKFSRTGEEAPLLFAAHRGDTRSFPSNTIPAIEHAISKGVDIVEVDTQITADGHVVLNHDETVARTTTGGDDRVDAMTLEQFLQLNAREGFGDKGTTPDSGVSVATFDQALDVVEGRAMINMDKGWPIREEIYAHLEQRGMVDYGLFKGTDLDEAEAFLQAHPDAKYVHIIETKTGFDNSADAQAILDRNIPVAAVELVFWEHSAPFVQPEMISAFKEQGIRVWMNSFNANYSGGGTINKNGLTEEGLMTGLGSFPELVAKGADIIQTDNVELATYWRDRHEAEDVGASYLRQPAGGSHRVEAESFLPGENGVDYYNAPGGGACSGDDRLPGAIEDQQCTWDGIEGLRYLRAGDWYEWSVDLPEAGEYLVSLRAAPIRAGSVRIAFGDQEYGDPIPLSPATSEHRLMEMFPVGYRLLDAGEHRFRIEFGPESSYQAADFIQFDLVSEGQDTDPGESDPTSSVSSGMSSGSSL
ncbi:glycerophosphodiester phosphodiesterase family protein [Corynebacterium sp.]|uniref:glycerophosphodiester phosphodiesterase family protein n=1 Tax=Corynebacterium sp. TaxID=1720 RepID=UPI0026DFB27C|nr:glycerophosphodiester phosphodiesterase family protein [Corynebacterium sp.]MDO5512135.1 glycerophosphodiester phosphodiesterase family protein [Corynebacterium sp.]